MAVTNNLPELDWLAALQAWARADPHRFWELYPYPRTVSGREFLTVKLTWSGRAGTYRITQTEEDPALAVRAALSLFDRQAQPLLERQ
jgi:ABC-type uncharacterized transport system YnjBCD substrate-binding protein